MDTSDYTTNPRQITGFIYLITNKINGKQYVGQTIQTIRARWNAHVSESRRDDYPMAQAIKKYGAENFVVSEVARCNSLEQLNELEILFIQQYNTLRPKGYNLASGGKNAIPHPDTIQRLSESHKGQKPTQRQIERAREVNTGIVRSPETRRKIGLASKGRNVGRKHTAEHNAKQSASLRGRKFSAEHKAKIGASLRGKPKKRKTESTNQITEN